mmetsp:Transcript_13336/g.22664  ORF Transcript_13336/g.22664 Transcript_13336/m.22664 type:complete len:91 (+) Transcript_13336:126-398(+)
MPSGANQSEQMSNMPNGFVNMNGGSGHMMGNQMHSNGMMGGGSIDGSNIMSIDMSRQQLKGVGQNEYLNANSVKSMTLTNQETVQNNQLK